ncbi:MAG: hypothetical protein ACYCWE_03890 [Eubacteriales bacterium]
MRNKMFSALMIGFLVIPMLCFTFISCSENNEIIPAATESEITEAEDSTAAEPMPDVPASDFEGYKFRIMARGSEHEKFTAVDITSDGPNGEPINDAVYKRNLRIEENFNASVTNVAIHYPASNMKKFILAGDDTADLITDSLNELASLLTASYLVDFAQLQYIDFDKPWWDGNLIHGLSILNKNYMMTGDISIMDNTGTWVIGFNKDMIDEHHLDIPYDLVSTGKWTYDKMFEMMKPVPADLDGNGQMDDFDRYAFVSEEYNTYALLVGSGAVITSKDSDDLPFLSIYSDNTLLALDKVFNLMLDQSMTLLSGNVKGTYNHVFDECINKNFGEGRALFWMGSMKVVEILRGYDVNFGLLPTPKLSEEQQNYHGSYSTYNCTAYSVPITNTGLERTGILTEAMAAYSADTLTPAYYEITLKTKSLRDTDSEAMLDLVFASRLYDLGAVFDWGGFINTFMNMTAQDKRDFASEYAKSEPKALTAIDKFIGSLENAG